VTFEPANPGVLSALGTGSEVTIQGINTGKTSLQAKSKCGEPTGPAVEVEVVNCDDETKDRLEKMKKAAIENLVAAAKDLQGIAGSEEFEKARDELVSSYVDLLAKVGLTIISNGKTKGVVTKVVDGKEVISKAIPRAAQIAEYGSALSEIIGSSSPEQLKDNIGKTASGEAFEKIVSTQFGEAADDLLGKAGSAAIGLAEVADAANKFYNNVGQLIHHEDMIEKFQEILEKADKELKNIRNRQQLCGKQTDKPDKQEKPKAEQKTQPTEPKPSAKPTPETNKPTAQEPQTSESTAGKPTTEDEVLVDPEFPKPPSRQVGLPFEPSDCGCDKTKDLTASTVGFSTLGTGIQNLGDCVKDFSSTTLTDYQQALEELSALTDSLSTILKTDGAAFLVKAKESKPRLDAIVNRVKVYEEEGNAFLNKMEKCPESLNIGMEIFQSVEQITVDSIKTNY
jgi:hypothetical protein